MSNEVLQIEHRVVSNAPEMFAASARAAQEYGSSLTQAAERMGPFAQAEDQEVRINALLNDMLARQKGARVDLASLPVVTAPRLSVEMETAARAQLDAAIVESTVALNANTVAEEANAAASNSAGSGMRGGMTEMRAMRGASMEAVVGLQMLTLALGQTMPQAAQEAVKGLQMVSSGAMMGMMFGPPGIAVGALAGGLLALGIAMNTIDPDIAALNKSLDAVGKKDAAVEGLMKTTGATQALATAALAASKNNVEQTATLKALNDEAVRQQSISDNAKSNVYQRPALPGVSDANYFATLQSRADGATAAALAEEKLIVKNKELETSYASVAKALDNLKPHDALIDGLVQIAGVSQTAATHIADVAKKNDEVATSLSSMTAGLGVAQSALLNYKGSELDVAQALQADVDAQKGAIAAYIDHTALVDALAGKNANLTVTFVDETQALHDTTDAAHGLVTELGNLDKYSKAGNIRAAGDADAWAVTKQAIRDQLKDQGQVSATPGVEGPLATKLAQEATSARNKAAAEELADQQKQVAMNDKIAAASTEMTTIQVANMLKIANAAQPVETRMAEISAYISSLSNAKDINMAVTFGGNLDLMKMLGLGGAKPGSRDFGVEAAMQFSQVDSATQAADVKAAGGDKSKAADTWLKDHMAGLVSDLLRDPKQFVNTGVYSSAQAALSAPSAAQQAAAGQPPMAQPAGQAGAAGTAASGVQPMVDAAQQQLSQTTYSASLLASVTKDQKGLKSVGDAMGALIGAQAAVAISSALADGAGPMANSLFGLLDGRYQKIPRSPYVPPS